MKSITRFALKVNQPLGDFYVFGLNAIDLNDITYSQPARIMQRLEAESSDSGSYSIFGSQRTERKNRLVEIANFIKSTEATFPNAIILAANYDDQGYLVDEESSRRWVVKHIQDNLYELTIPVGQEPSASIIDGQHRLHAFTKLPDNSPHKNMELLCAAFLDLPTPYHAYIFATINFNQKKVDRGLAYELFGFDVEEKPKQFWPPETLAVYLTRVFNTAKDSPFRDAISSPAIAAEMVEKVDQPQDENNFKEPPKKILVSMATVVDGILSLISKNPKDDRYTMRRPENLDIGRLSLADSKDLPLRKFYLSGNDLAIMEVVTNYFTAVSEQIWDKAGADSYLIKTVGIQAQFDVLKKILQNIEVNSKNYSVVSLSKLFENFEPPQGVDYQASGIGRNDIKKDLLKHLNM